MHVFNIKHEATLRYLPFPILIENHCHFKRCVIVNLILTSVLLFVVDVVFVKVLSVCCVY